MKSVKTSFVFLWLVFCQWLHAQSISGQLEGLAGKELVLEGYLGNRTYIVGKVIVGATGQFTIPYKPSQYGIGLLSANPQAQLLVLLNGESIVISGHNLDDAKKLTIIKGHENKLFAQYKYEQGLRDKAIEAWAFLDDLYFNQPFFRSNTKNLSSAQQLIIEELERLRQQEQAFIDSLPRDNYLNWFLNTKKLIGSVANVVKYRPEYGEPLIRFFRELNYADVRLYKSGLLGTALGNHFYLINNAFADQKQRNQAAKVSIDVVFNKLLGNDELTAEIADMLISLFMQQGLDDFAEYLAAKILGENACTLNNNTKDKLESYRKMKVGNKASDINFGSNAVFPQGIKKVGNLSELSNNYTLVVFAASWCGHCQSELPNLVALYPKLKAKGLEVVLVALDEDKNAYDNWVKSFPFISTSNFKKWESPLAKDYYVFATPTYILLDKDLKILAKIRSPAHLDDWFSSR
jgi:thiol-disulfide isomerase/thioredoxin